MRKRKGVTAADAGCVADFQTWKSEIPPRAVAALLHFELQRSRPAEIDRLFHRADAFDGKLITGRRDERRNVADHSPGDLGGSAIGADGRLVSRLSIFDCLGHGQQIGPVPDPAHERRAVGRQIARVHRAKGRVVPRVDGREPAVRQGDARALAPKLAKGLFPADGAFEFEELGEVSAVLGVPFESVVGDPMAAAAAAGAELREEAGSFGEPRSRANKSSHSYPPAASIRWSSEAPMACQRWVGWLTAPSWGIPKTEKVTRLRMVIFTTSRGGTSSAWKWKRFSAGQAVLICARAASTRWSVCVAPAGFSFSA